MSRRINTTDASLGNVIRATRCARCRSRRATSSACSPCSPAPSTCPNDADRRWIRATASVSGARADQSNVTLDGIDVNDPQFGTAFTCALRVTLDSLQEFRVTTSNYGAEAGRSSAAQVSLVTKSGTNSFHGSGYYVHRDTKFSSNEYFLKLSQLAGQRARRRSSTRTSTAARSAARSEGQAVLLRQLRGAARGSRRRPSLRAVPSRLAARRRADLPLRRSRRRARAARVQRLHEHPRHCRRLATA